MPIFFAGLGLIIGSFLNVVILREGTGKGIMGRSHCPSCKKELAWYDLVPVVSWIVLLGKCRYCKRSISIQYPLVESVTALLFVGVGLAPLPLPLQVLALIFVSLGIAITVYDIQHMMIPDLWSYGFSAVALLYALFSMFDMSTVPLVILAGPLCAFPLWALWAISQGRWMGLGDVKFALGMGWLLGPFIGFVSLLYAFVLGAAVSVFILLPLQHLRTYAHSVGITWLSGGDTRFTMKSEVPFGPFLVFSCITIWFLTVYGVPILFVP